MATRTCPNCESPAPGAFCPECGQRQTDSRMTMRAMLRDFAEDQFGVNARTWHTLRALLTRPGWLSTEYFNGRINRYITPFKLYLITSVLFFVLINTFTMRSVTRGLASEIAGARDSVQTQTRLAEDSAGVPARPDTARSWLSDVNIDFGNRHLNRMAKEHVDRLAAMGPEEGTRRLITTGFAQAPRVMFLLLPLYALLLYVFFHRQRRYYVEHFVFALHFHSFVYLILIPTFLSKLDFLGTVATITILLYAFVGMRRFYQHNWLSLVFKFALIWALYWMIFVLGIVVSLFFVLAAI